MSTNSLESMTPDESIESYNNNIDNNSITTSENNTEEADSNRQVPLMDIKPNMLFYGVPGAGKSHTIKGIIAAMRAESERVVFHPDYTYSDFIGQILPKKEGDKLTYDFIPGPFTRILSEAKADPGNNYVLVIEEINRGNAPAIFGDIFQLLDRKKDGDCDYEITNTDIVNEVNKKLDDNEKIDKVKLPKNLYIFATMNTSDQNVFTLDTAFKRRWAMRCIRNDFSKCEFADYKIGNTGIKWGAFAEVINDKIAENSSGLSSEDKRLGAFFIREDELNKTDFGEKVLMYLWDDAFKYSRDNVFQEKYNTLEEVLEDFEKHGFKDTASFTSRTQESEEEQVEDIANETPSDTSIDEAAATAEPDENSPYPENIEQESTAVGNTTSGTTNYYVFNYDIVEDMFQKNRKNYFVPNQSYGNNLSKETQGQQEQTAPDYTIDSNNATNGRTTTNRNLPKLSEVTFEDLQELENKDFISYFRELVQNNGINSEILNKLQNDKTYQKEILGISCNFPFLGSRDMFVEPDHRFRAYIDPVIINGKELYICAQFKKTERDKFNRWLFDQIETYRNR